MPEHESEGEPMSITTKAELVAERDAAMKAKFAASTPEDRETATLRLSLVRQLLGAVEAAEKPKSGIVVLTSDDIVRLLKNQQSTRLETVALLIEKGGDPERIAAEQAEANAIAEYLPQAASEVELREFLTAFIAEQGDKLPAGGAAIGVAMKALKAQYENFDSKLASTIIRELI